MSSRLKSPPRRARGEREQARAGGERAGAGWWRRQRGAVARQLLIGTLVLAAAGVVLVLRPAAAPGVTTAPVTTAPVTTATPSGRPKLLDLGATTCVPCKAMVPVLEGLRTDYAGKLDVEFIDLWKNHEAGETWHVAIMPTQLFLSPDGRELARHEGFISRDDILAQWKRLGVALD